MAFIKTPAFPSSIDSHLQYQTLQQPNKLIYEHKSIFVRYEEEKYIHADSRLFDQLCKVS